MDMLIGLVLLSVVFDSLLFIKIFWQFRLPIIIISTTFSIVAASFAAGYLDFTLVLLVGLIILFRFIVFARAIANRLHTNHLAQSTKRSILALDSSLLIFVLVISFFNGDIAPFVLELTAVIQAVFAMTIFAFVVNSVVQTKYHEDSAHLSDSELPTVTVAIPARNETDDLKECIDTVLSSDYPKLEVLVLDDCSQGKKPPEVIKQHAHAGVRFLQGTPSPENWLAKNHAYQQLADEATGSIIVFIGVDVRMSPTYLRKLITHMKLKQKRMISVLPIRYQSNLLSGLVQPMRYWWELALPRKLLNRPAVLSTCWVIQKKVLQKLGSFHAVKKSVIPERYFARECVKHDRYSFIRASEELDLRTTKQPRHQMHTAYRVRYPQFRSRIESVLLYVLLLALLFVSPFFLLFVSLIFDNQLLLFLSSLSVLFLTLSHLIITTISHPANSLVAIINLPLAVLSEMTLTIYSMLQYEFGSVIWKGRNICLPVLSGQQDTKGF